MEKEKEEMYHFYHFTAINQTNEPVHEMIPATSMDEAAYELAILGYTMVIFETAKVGKDYIDLQTGEILNWRE